MTNIERHTITIPAHEVAVGDIIDDRIVGRTYTPASGETVYLSDEDGYSIGSGLAADAEVKATRETDESKRRRERETANTRLESFVKNYKPGARMASMLDRLYKSASIDHRDMHDFASAEVEDSLDARLYGILTSPDEDRYRQVLGLDDSAPIGYCEAEKFFQESLRTELMNRPEPQSLLDDVTDAAIAARLPHSYVI